MSTISGSTSALPSSNRLINKAAEQSIEQSVQADLSRDTEASATETPATSTVTSSSLFTWGDLLSDLQLGLKSWNHHNAQHSPADDREALILARGKIEHALPQEPFQLQILLNRQGDLPVGTIQIELLSINQEPLISMTIQDLGDNWLWTPSGHQANGPTAQPSLLLANNISNPLDIIFDQETLSLHIGDETLCRIDLQQSLGSFSIHHIPLIAALAS